MKYPKFHAGPGHIATENLFDAAVQFCLAEQEITARRRKARALRQACERREEGGCFGLLHDLCGACVQRDALTAERGLGKPRTLARKTLLRRFAKWQQRIRELTADPDTATGCADDQLPDSAVSAIRKTLAATPGGAE